MMIEIDFNSEEAIYMQLTNQIIHLIATSSLQEGDVLPLCASWPVTWESTCIR